MSQQQRGLHWGGACLNCRKKRAKCDGQRPCGRCVKSLEETYCKYDTVKKSRITLLRERVQELEEQNQLLRAGSSSNSVGLPSPLSESSASISPMGRSFTSVSEESGSLPPWHEAGHGPSTSQHQSPSNADHSQDTYRGPRPPTFHVSPEAEPSPQLIPRPNRAYSGDQLVAFPSPETSSGEEQSVEFFVSPEMRDHLLTIFLDHRHQYFFEVSMDRFLPSAFRDNPSPNIHPGLLDAVFLLACYFSPHQSSIKRFESRFLSRAQHSLVEALQDPAYVLDYIQAQCLLSVYFYHTGRMLEAYQASCAGAHAAVMCGLHQITPSSTLLKTDDTPASGVKAKGTRWQDGSHYLPPPEDSTDLNLRVQTFWTAYLTDACGSIASGMTPVFDDRQGLLKLMAQMPLGWESGSLILASDYMNGCVPLFPRRERPPNSPPYNYSDAIALRIKCVSLSVRASNLPTRNSLVASSSTQDAFATAFDELEQSVVYFEGTVPPLRSSEQSEINAGADADADPILCTVHLSLQYAMMKLHEIYVSCDYFSYDKRLRAAKQVVKIVQLMMHLDWHYLDFVLGNIWFTAFEVLTDELETYPLAHRNSPAIEEIQIDLNTLVYALHQLGRVVPVVEIQAQRAERVRQKSLR